MTDGQKLRTLRTKRGISGTRVAEELGVSKQAIRSREQSTNVGLGAALAYLNGIERILARTFEEEPTLIDVIFRVEIAGGQAQTTAGGLTLRELQEVIE